jgi:methylenetetrahydrofolate reductase (NADPH)
MGNVLNFFSRKPSAPVSVSGEPLTGLLQSFSLEVMPRTAAKIESFADILPAGSRVYIAHIDGTPIEDMVATAKRIAAEGMQVMPHLPARIIPDRATLNDWLARYAGEAGVDQALLLAGGLSTPKGDFHSSMQLMETGLLDAHGITRLHVAGHPEGNRDIDRHGDTVIMEALRWKQDFANRTDAKMAIATQFCFDAAPIFDWAARLKEGGVDLPIHIGVAGPAKLQTLVKFAMTCGVGPSVRVLQRRAADVTKLMLPFTPESLLRDIAARKAADPALQIEAVHFFPLGGIKATTDFTGRFSSAGAMRARVQA